MLTGPLGVLVPAHRPHRAPTTSISATEGVPDEVRGRAMPCASCEMLPVECVVRGYITGSGWKDYQATGTVSGIELPPGLRESEQLPTPIFTPSTKADVGHDEAIDFDRAAELVGDRELMGRAARRVDRAVRLRRRPRAPARRHPRRHEVRVRPRRRRRARRRRRGPDARLLALLAGRRLRARAAAQPSFDKQFVRDWAVGTRLGQDAAGARDPRRRRRRHARPLRRGLRADHRRARSTRGSAAHRRREGAAS